MKKFLIITGVVLLLMVAAQQSVVFKKSPLISKTAPDFTLKTLEGQKNFTQFRDGQRAIVFFWATWCPHCREALKDLNTRKEEFAQKNIKLVLVDIGEMEDEVRSYLSRNGVSLNIFLDEKSEVAEYYKVIGVPAFFFVDPNGVIQDVQHHLPDNYEENFGKE